MLPKEGIAISVVTLVGIRQPNGQIICTFILNSDPNQLIRTFIEDDWTEDEINYMIALPVLNLLYSQITEDWGNYGEFQHRLLGTLSGGKWFANPDDLSIIVASAYGENPLFSQMACLYDQKPEPGWSRPSGAILRRTRFPCVLPIFIPWEKR